MSVSTVTNSIEALDFEANSRGEFDLVGMLLRQQQELTAVERFSRVHDKGIDDEDLPDGPSQAKYYQSLLPATPPNERQQFAFEVDLDACSGCKACVVACHTLNGLEENESWRRVGTVTIGGQISPGVVGTEQSVSTDAVAVQHVTTACHHCEDPGCLNGCPVKAYDKDAVTGIVRHLDDQCIGCKYCTMMCPYEVPKYSKRLGIVRKCDMCHNRLAVGEAPACVQSCPNAAIRIRLVERTHGFVANHDANSALAPGAPPSDITNPTTVYTGTHNLALGVPADQGLDQVAESHWPLAALLIATQIGVGMLVAERVGALFLSIGGGEMPWSVTASVAAAAMVISGIGLNVAQLHLGQPLRAWRVFLGLRTSWLSREAVILGQYMAALTLANVLLWLPLLEDRLPETVGALVRDYVPSWAAKPTLIVAALIGLVGLYSSAMIYIATKRPLWRHGRTLTRFGATAAIGGIVFAVAVLVACSTWTGHESRGTTALAIGGLLLAAVGLAGKLIWEWQVHLGPLRSTDHPHDRRSRALTVRKMSDLRTARLASGLLSLVMMTITSLAIVFSGDASWLALGLVTLASLTVLLGEVAERLLYFMSVVYDRMPGTLR